MAPTKWALITGVSQYGLGDALAKELLSHNINVIATAPTLTQLDYLSPAANATSTARLEELELDVTSPSSIASAVSTTNTITSGHLDVLINNAGYGYMQPLLDASITEIKKNFDVNVFGLLAVTQAFFPLLRVAKGTVVNQASIAGLQGICQPFIGSYSASKGAVIDFSDTMRVEFAPFEVKVVTLITGDVRTGFWNHVEAGEIGGVGIPESSVYQPIKDKVNALLTRQTNPTGQHSAEHWAKAVAGDLLSTPAPSKIRRGYLASAMGWMSWMAPNWLLDWFFGRMCDLEKLKIILNGEVDKKKR